MSNPSPRLEPKSGHAPFSPALLLGLALRPVRPSLLQPAFDAGLRAVVRRHPDMFERMGSFGDAAVCLDPVDLPFVLLMEPHATEPRLTVRASIEPEEVSATIRGPMATLIALAEGRVDGDALFFSRELVVEGDTEVIVALRNAIDGAGLDLMGDLLRGLGPFAGPVRGVGNLAASLFGWVGDEVESLRRSLIARALAAADAQNARLAELEAEVASLRKQVRAKGRAAS